MTPSIGEARTFLTWLFERSCEENYYLSLFVKPSKSCLFFRDVETAAAKAIEAAATQDVYANGAVFKTPPESGRGSVDDVAGMVGLRVDMDYGKSGHKDKNYPPTLEDALNLLKGTGLPPSVVVASGNGLHGWWLFKEPWLCLPPDESGTKREIQKLSRAWHETLKVIALSQKFTLDSVFDLTRVLRVPGTFNHKDPANLKPVKILEPLSGEPRRYLRDDFDMFLVSEESYRHSNARYEFVQPVHPRPDIPVDEPPPKVALLMEADTKFSDTINRRRKDMKDPSPSAYDMALANILVRADCTDQEIADIILWTRKKNNEKPEKALRRDYLMTTIGKARVSYEKYKAQEELTILPPLPKDASKEDRDERRARNLEYVTKTLGIQMRQVIRHGTEDARYEFVLEDGTNINIGDAGQLLNQEQVRKRILDQAAIMIEMLKKPVWLKAVNALRQLADTVLDEESTRRETIFAWLRNYCFNYTLPDESEQGGPGQVTEAVGTARPYIKGASIYIHVPDLGKYLRSEQDERVSNLDLRQLLRLVGWKQTKVYGKSASKSNRICRSYWFGPIKDVYDEGRESTEAGGPSEGEAPVRERSA